MASPLNLTLTLALTLNLALALTLPLFQAGLVAMLRFVPARSRVERAHSRVEGAPQVRVGVARRG